MKPNGIRFEPGKFHPAFNFSIYLDLAESEPIPKPRGSTRIDYNKNNYCARCVLKFPKTELRCNQCSNRLRTKPWHGRSNFANGGRY
jgi:hypothetical protein